MTLSELLAQRIMTGPELARKVKKDHSTIYRWAKGKLPISAEDAVAVEAATDGRVTRAELRPDLWSPAERAA